jgi:predicted NBD/HSP70 family sugar kinase
VLVEGKLQVGRTGPGRPSVELSFGTDCYVAGIGIRGYAQWVELRRLGAEAIASEPFVCADLTDPVAVLQQCCGALDTLLKRRHVQRYQVLGLGVLMVGVVDALTGTVLRAENLGWRRVDVQRILDDMVDYPVTIETMLNGMNSLRSMHECKPVANALLVSVALGIGASLIIDGRIVRGAGFAAGQFGHLRSRSSDLKCVCGRCGCLDTVCSGRAILKIAESMGALTGAGGTPVERYRQLCSHARRRRELAEELARAGHELGRAVGSAIAVVDPQEIVFTGFVTEDEHYYEAVVDELVWYQVGTSAQRPRCVRRQHDGEGAPSMLAAMHLTARA